jgi:cytosine/uracil/thiamine/allantoin permease
MIIQIDIIISLIIVFLNIYIITKFKIIGSLLTLLTIIILMIHIQSSYHIIENLTQYFEKLKNEFKITNPFIGFPIGTILLFILIHFYTFDNDGVQK